LRLTERWQLTRAELATLLGIRSTSTLDNWRRNPPVSLSPDTLERISYLLHIHGALRQIFPVPRATEWLRRPNDDAPFLGKSALAFMLGGRMQHLLDTHRHLQNVAAGVF
jgi:transcriptional regulator with XRE-family HTH domain